MSEIVEKFQLTLTELMEQKGIGICELAKELNTSRFVIHKWLTEAKDMRIKALIKIADYFRCSIDYLCGRTDSYLEFVPKELPKFSDRLKYVLVESNKSSYRMFKDTRIAPSQLHQWTYNTHPMLNNLEIMAKYLCVSIDYLIGRERRNYF